MVVERREAQRALDALTDEQLDKLEAAYSKAAGGDEFAIGRKLRWMYQEAVRLGWMLGPA